LGLLDQHASARKLIRIDAGGEFEIADLGRNHVIRLAEQSKPKRTDLREHAALVGNARRQNPIERADAVGAHE